MAFSSSQRPQQGFILHIFLIAVFGIVLCIVLARTYILPPTDFPQNAVVVVKSGDDLGTVAYNLQTAHIVRSAEAFKLLMLAFGSDQRISVGSYRFPVPVTAVEVALKMSGKEFGVLENKVTFPEGYTNKEMAARLGARFPALDTAQFLSLAQGKQGYLFPDTYGFDPSVSPDIVIDTLTKTFNEKTAPLASEFAASKHSKEEIVIMASILEKEAATADEMPVIAGILWKRIEKGIALQVDAPLAQLLGKTSDELTTRDLANPTPYNTYVHKGLPPAPINNPGLAAIEAALRPVDSPYLYYLHDRNGGIHYASTFEGHKKNKAKYLD